MGIHWTKARCLEDALLYEARGKWSKGSSSAYSSALRNDWADECCSHMPKPKSKVRRGTPAKWHKVACMEDAKKYSRRSDWQKKSNSAYNSAKNNDWLDECCAHMPIINKGSIKRKTIEQYWDKDSCKVIALGFTTSELWRASHSRSYYAAKRNGWLRELSAHMGY